MKTSQQIRQEFIDFFVKMHGHTFVPSSPVVPQDDPTLLFTNAGMNQFKPIFLGQEKRAYTRAANTQKCIRAGGKHNDLDDVGRSRRHHTFFEMLGNWSFGDYFKRGAIEMSWELLTKVWGIDPTRLHVSCFEGDEKNGVPRDEEAANIWREVANWEQYGRKSEEHIHYFGKDNFWEMGDTGPCGPCTEIYIDRTPDKTGGKHVNGEDPRVMEIWNNVFIQYNRNADRSLVTLPAQHVDTGMGFERITQVLQNVGDNYAIDLFNPFWEKLTALSGIKYGGAYPVSNVADPAAEAASPGLRHDIAFRVIADHVRCLTFALTDGAVPSNEGRGYVLRRILRRAVRFGRQQLELKEPFLHTLVPVVVEAMGGAFPELKKNPGRVSEIIKDEEISFSRTLDRGIELFYEAAHISVKQYMIADMVDDFHPASIMDWSDRADAHAIRYPVNLHPKPVISATDAFKLHDTYGFPIDLTRIMAEERGMTVDLEGYEKLMEEARQLARSGGKESESTLADLPPDAIAKLQGEKIPPTNDQPKYKGESISATVQAIWDGEKFIDKLDDTPERLAAVILDRTNFYAEMGGQVGDQGGLRMEEGLFSVENTQNVGGYVLHIGQMLSCGRNGLRVGDTVNLNLANLRQRTQKNHTTTHLANWALREVLGNDVQQKGSLVDPEKLRFDFSHGKSVTDEELGKVETLVNEGIEKKLPVYAEEAPQELALKINGLRAVFGEKYPPRVRVVSIGAPVAELLKDPANEKWRQYSIEFCGGTHLANSGDAQTFAIIAEESVSKGIRRIVALTGEAASAAGSSANQIASAIEEAQTLTPDKIPTTIAAIQKQLASLTLPLRAKRKAQAAIGELQAKYKIWEKSNKSQQGGEAGVDVIDAASKLLAAASDLGGGKVIVGEIPGVSDDHLRRAIDSLKKRATSHGILLASSIDGKVTFIAAVSDDLVNKGLKAGDWVRETSKVAGGSGGGRPQMAQAGGKDPAKVAEALETAKKFASSALGAKG
jgi:alanyl-tRNA synthetase